MEAVESLLADAVVRGRRYMDPLDGIMQATIAAADDMDTAGPLSAVGVAAAPPFAARDAAGSVALRCVALRCVALLVGSDRQPTAWTLRLEPRLRS